MTNRKSTKRALLGSIMAMVLCLAMLIGATFAWFTDTASTGVNKITSGNLDVEIVNKEGEKVTSLKWVKAEGAAAESVLWEPGCRYQLEPFQIVNNGNLALKYKLVITGLTGDADLLKVIQFTYTIGDETLDLAGEGHLTAKGTDGAKSQPITITGAMDTAAGNEYMNKKLDNISITVVATQDTVESDSFGTQYDKDAEYPVAVTTGDELQAIVNNATAPVNIVLANSITTNNFVIPEDKDVTLDLNGRTVTNAESHTILNKGHLTLKDSSADKSGQIISLKGNTAALRNGDNAVCVVEGGTISRDGANGNTWHVVENFGKIGRAHV